MGVKTSVAMAVAGVLLVSGVVLFIKYDDWVEKPKAIEAKRSYAVQQMRDPATVQFKEERLTPNGWLCGELNGKNAYGAYAGFKQFLSRAPDDVYIEGSGYVGKERHVFESARALSDNLDISIEVARSVLAVAKEHPDLPKPTQPEIDAMTERAIFKKRWTDHCT